MVNRTRLEIHVGRDFFLCSVEVTEQKSRVSMTIIDWNGVISSRSGAVLGYNRHFWCLRALAVEAVRVCNVGWRCVRMGFMLFVVVLIVLT